MIQRNFQAFTDEGPIYVAPQVSAFGYRKSDGTPIPPDDVAPILRARLAKPDVKVTGLKYRFRQVILRLLPQRRAGT